EAVLDVVERIAVAARVERAAAQPDPVEIVGWLGGGEKGGNPGGPAGEGVVAVLPEQAVDLRGDLETVEMAVHAVAEIDRIVAARAHVADDRWPRREAVVVDLDLILLPVDVPGDARRAGDVEQREILAIDIG